MQAALCELFILFFDIRTDVHLTVAMDEGVKDLSKVIEHDSPLFCGESPERGPESPDFLAVMFDLVLHQHSRLSQMAMWLACRQYSQYDELIQLVHRCTVLTEDGNAECIHEMTQARCPTLINASTG